MKLQAFFDKELPEKEAQEVAAWVARDAEAKALLGELQNTSRALGGFEQELKLPESREFYWSKIKREIERPQPAESRAESRSMFSLWRRFLMPVGALAVFAIAGVVALKQFGGSASRPVPVSAMLADAGAFTYRDQAQGMTVIWLSYPAQKPLANNN